MNSVKKYRKLPVVIEAIQWNGNNQQEIMDFVGKQLRFSRVPAAMEHNFDCPDSAYNFMIPTLEGNMMAVKNDYIIKGINGEFYPCKPDIFAKTYEQLESVLEQAIEKVGQIEDIKEKIKRKSL